ncbi:MAG: hypothetical protein WC332_00775 [Clostridia bacterium]|jgi:uncharacterized protein YbaR (Trm112 family)
MNAIIYDIVACPVCNGKKQIQDGQVMKDNRVYQIVKPCPKCKGKGKIGQERKGGFMNAKFIGTLKSGEKVFQHTESELSPYAVEYVEKDYTYLVLPSEAEYEEIKEMVKK